MARAKKRTTPDEYLFDVRRIASTAENTSKGILTPSGREAVEGLNALAKQAEKSANEGSIYDAGVIGTMHDSIDMDDFTPSALFFDETK